jgi:hypothetical protein
VDNELFYLDVHKCGNVSEGGKFYVKEKLKKTVVILEEKIFQNPYRQRGIPNWRRQLNNR